MSRIEGIVEVRPAPDSPVRLSRTSGHQASATVRLDGAPLPHVLAVDDDATTRALIAEYLAHNEFRVTAVVDGPAMRAVLAEEMVDLVVLDVSLKGDDGMTLTRRLREASAIPIIMLSARNEEADRVMGLELGADDYITKPFSPRELLARIRTVLRRRRTEAAHGRPKGVRGYRFDGWELNLNTRRMTIEGRLVPLSNAQFSLLVVLLGSPQRILTRDQLLQRSRLHNDEIFDRSIDTQIMRLRRKLEKDPAHPRYIRTERGVGYLFAMPVETVY
jgi:DNA-binding response OmpR family regulator